MHICSGYAQFINSTYQVFENDGSVQVCVRAEGYGFAVNVLAGIYSIRTREGKGNLSVV